MNQAYEYTLKFDPYTYLWEDDRLDYLDQFLKYGHQLSQEEIDARNAGEEFPDFNPTLEQFKEVVSTKLFTYIHTCTEYNDSEFSKLN
jgi:dynein heavy chain